MIDPGYIAFLISQQFKYCQDKSIEWQKESDSWNRKIRVPFSFYRGLDRKECNLIESKVYNWLNNIKWE